LAYFIILVQRPLKIGDFIKIDQDTFGFVRKITPRAVIIRKKNSTTIVIPNSQIINKTITNWNYVRNFIAFDDICIVIVFKEDPHRVKELLFNAVSSHPNVLRNPRPVVRLEDFTEYGYMFIVRGFVSSAFTQDMWDIASDIRLSIIKALKENNIEIAEYMRVFKNGLTSRVMIQDRNTM
jgi:small-conductance mechanosensitive channel